MHDHTYRRNPHGYTPGSAEDQGVVARAELATQGLDAEPPAAARERYVQRISDVHDQRMAERAARALEHYRPELVAEFGETLTAQVLDHTGFAAYVAEVDAWLEPDEAAYDAIEYLRKRESATPADAFTAIRDELAGL